MSQTFFVAIGLLICVGTAVARSPFPPPWNWSLPRVNPAGVDATVRYNDKPSLYVDAAFPPKTELSKTFPDIRNLIRVQQAIKADLYRSRIMRWSAYMRTEDVGSIYRDDPPGATRLTASEDQSPGAGLYVMIDSHKETTLYTMTRNRLIGTSDWTKVEMYIDVPPESVLITLGFFLGGRGKLWAAGFEFEGVTSPYDAIRDLDLTNEQQIYDYLIARHRKRLKQYGRSPDSPVLRIEKPRSHQRGLVNRAAGHSIWPSSLPTSAINAAFR